VLPAPRPSWVPATAVAALATVLVVSIVPWLRPGWTVRQSSSPSSSVAVSVPTRVSVPAAPRSHQAGGAAASRSGSGASSVAMMADSLFDHSEDVEFILDPVTVRRGHVHPARPHVAAVQGQQATITF
jgi:hypothetical protein